MPLLQGLAFGFVLLRVESLAEEGKVRGSWETMQSVARGDASCTGAAQPTAVQHARWHRCVLTVVLHCGAAGRFCSPQAACLQPVRLQRTGWASRLAHSIPAGQPLTLLPSPLPLLQI